MNSNKYHNKAQLTNPTKIPGQKPWAPDSLKFMKDLGSRVTEANGEKSARSFLFQSLIMNLQRGNAVCVIVTENWKKSTTKESYQLKKISLKLTSCHLF